MEDGTPTAHLSSGSSSSNHQPPRDPPPRPSPSADPAVTANVDATHTSKPNEPLRLTSEEWDIFSISDTAALHMLIQALEPLAEQTGDIPPTPPVSRPTTPRRETDEYGLHRLSSPDSASHITIGSPEAPLNEPLPCIGADVEDTTRQQAAIARRFFSKIPPPFSLSDYLLRMHKYCAHSPGVYLAAAAYCHRLCVAELMVPATNRTVHRLALAAIRVAAKSLEDNKWSQDRMAKVGGVSLTQLMNLEVTLCFLLDFDLWVDERGLARRMFLLQQAARHGGGVGSRLNDSFKLKLPLRRRLAQASG